MKVIITKLKKIEKMNGKIDYIKNISVINAKWIQKDTQPCTPE